MTRGRKAGVRAPTAKRGPAARKDWTVSIRTARGVRCLHVSPRARLAVAGLTAALGVWLVASTATLALHGLSGAAADAQDGDIVAVFAARTGSLEQALDAAQAARAAAEARAAAALSELAARHDALAEAAARTAGIEAELRAQAEALAALSHDRDAAAAAAAAAEAEAERAAAALAAAAAERDDLADTLMRIAGALDETAAARDDARAAAIEATGALDDVVAGVERDRDRQVRLLAEVEKAAELSIAPLERMLRAAGVDVDGVIEKLRREPDGAGGPFIPAYAAPADETAAKAVAVIGDLERVRLLREAATRMPFATPVRNPRFTSGFGPRRDPFNRRAAMHEGVDLAGPRGTPILAPAEGVVTFAGTQRGYGRIIRIRHDFGFETLYGHLSRIRVSVGDRVSVGQRIGDMGNTGRSTGTHLHYEVRVNGRPVNPMKFIGASRHVL
jgi:murein DD-endopeptidase MepM/ murein hydrolase activator NlpD